jgi:basic membrane protein A
MKKSKRALAVGIAAALGVAGIAIGAGSSPAGAAFDPASCATEAAAEGTEAMAETTAAAEATEAAVEATEAAGTEAAGTEAAGTEAAGTEPAATEGEGITEGSAVEGAVNVALMYDVTGRGDKSFNDAAAAGLDRAVSDFGVNGTESTPGGEGDRAERISAAAEGGNQLIVAVGFLWGNNVQQAAETYPDIHFAIVDSVVDLPNVASLVFAEEQGSYLVGAAAALASEDGHIGFVGGATIDLIRKFEAGFVAGAQCVNPDIEIEIEYVSDDPSIGFNDPTRGREIGAAMYEAGADVVYAAAGASGTGVLEATADAGEPGEVWNIGVDSDLYEQVDADLQPYILTSMLKRVDVATYSVIEAEVDGTFASGIQVFDLSVDGVGYSTSGGFVDEYVPTLDALKQAIIDGTIVVPSVPEE